MQAALTLVVVGLLLVPLGGLTFIVLPSGLGYLVWGAAFVCLLLAMALGLRGRERARQNRQQ